MRKRIAALITAACISISSVPLQTYGAASASAKVTQGSLYPFNAVTWVTVGNAYSRVEYENASDRELEKLLSNSGGKIDTNADRIASDYFDSPMSPEEILKNAGRTVDRPFTEKDLRDLLKKLGLDPDDPSITNALEKRAKDDLENTDLPKADPEFIQGLYDAVDKAQNNPTVSDEEREAALGGKTLGQVMSEGMKAMAPFLADLKAQHDQWAARDWARLISLFRKWCAQMQEAFDIQSYPDIAPWEVEIPNTDVGVVDNMYYDLVEEPLHHFQTIRGERVPGGTGADLKDVGISSNGKIIVCDHCGKYLTKQNANIHQDATKEEGFDIKETGWFITATGTWRCSGCYLKTPEEYEEEYGGTENDLYGGAADIRTHVPGQYSHYYLRKEGEEEGGDHLIYDDLPGGIITPDYYATAPGSMVVIMPTDYFFKLNMEQIKQLGKKSPNKVLDALFDVFGAMVDNADEWGEWIDRFFPNPEAASVDSENWDNGMLEDLRKGIEDFADEAAEVYNGGFPKDGFWDKDTKKINDREFKDIMDAICKMWPDDQNLWTPEMKAWYNEKKKQYGNNKFVKKLWEEGYFDKGADTLEMLNELLRDAAEYTLIDDGKVTVSMVEEYSDVQSSRYMEDQLVIGWYTYTITNAKTGRVVDASSDWFGGTRYYPCYTVGTFLIKMTPVLFSMDKDIYTAKVTRTWKIGDQVLSTRESTVVRQNTSGFNADSYIGPLEDASVTIKLTVEEGDFGNLTITTGHDSERVG